MEIINNREYCICLYEPTNICLILDRLKNTEYRSFPNREAYENACSCTEDNCPMKKEDIVLKY